MTTIYNNNNGDLKGFNPGPQQGNYEYCTSLYMQRNGQRIIGGPPEGWIGPPPSRGCEVYVTRIPRDCFENELVPIFSKIGPIYEHRLMMEHNGTNRGYGYVRFTSLEDAKESIKMLNNYEIRPGRYLVVTKSVDNRRLLMEFPSLEVGKRFEGKWRG